MANTPKHSVSVAGVVVDELDRILVIQRRDNAHWEPPGGVLELDETPEDGARREILEETGMSVEIDRLTGVYKNMKRGVIALVFLCRPTGHTVAMTDEARKVEWKSAADIERDMSPAYAMRVLDAISNKGPSVRSHDGFELLS